MIIGYWMVPRKTQATTVSGGRQMNRVGIVTSLDQDWNLPD
jgi:hypothetical protein